jgi:hypothetical protein
MFTKSGTHRWRRHGTESRPSPSCRPRLPAQDGRDKRRNGDLSAAMAMGAEPRCRVRPNARSHPARHVSTVPIRDAQNGHAEHHRLRSSCAAISTVSARPLLGPRSRSVTKVAAARLLLMASGGPIPLATNKRPASTCRTSFCAAVRHHGLPFHGEAVVRNGFDDQRMARGCHECVHLLTDLLTAALDQGGRARTPAGSRATERA